MDTNLTPRLLAILQMSEEEIEQQMLASDYAAGMDPKLVHEAARQTKPVVLAILQALDRQTQ